MVWEKKAKYAKSLRTISTSISPDFSHTYYSSKVVVIDYQGVRHDIEIPEGVRVYGEAYVNYGG